MNCFYVNTMPLQRAIFLYFKVTSESQHFIKNVIYGKAKKWAGFKPSK